MSLKAWQYGVIGLAILVVIIINVIIFWVLVTRNKKKKAESETVRDIESTNSRMEDEGTVIINDDHIQEIKIEEGELYGQHYASVTPSQTVLYPPPKQQQKGTQLETVPEQKTPSSTTSIVAERLLSLSPFRPHRSPQSAPTNSPHSTLDSRQTSSTPLQGSVNGSAWRGPTPPWTQYPGRNRS